MLMPLIIAALAVTSPSPALADTATTVPTTAEKAKDPNRKICEKIKKTGSRLSIVRVCMTARQWDEQRRDHRENFERAMLGAAAH